MRAELLGVALVLGLLGLLLAVLEGSVKRAKFPR